MSPRTVRVPAMVAGLLVSAFLCAVTPYNNIVAQNTPIAGGHFPVGSLCVVLLALVVANPLLGFFGRRFRLTAHEVLLLWAMVTIATGIAYTGGLRTFLLNVTTPGWLDATGNALGKTLLPLLPGSVIPTDPQALRLFYEGIEGGRDMPWWEIATRIPWGVWTPILLTWGIFVVLFFAALLGLTGLFSHQWIENEKMNFPLLRVPEILAEESEKGGLARYLTHRYFIIGLMIPVLLHLLNGLHAWYPGIPQIPTLILAQPYIPKEGLLSGFYKLKISIYPAFIGLAFLTSQQISFSLWAFFLAGGLLPGVLSVLGYRLPAAALGTIFGPVLSRVEEMQMIGAFLVYFLFIVWLARDHLLLTVRSLFGRARTRAVEFKGLLRPGTSLVVFVLAFAGLVAWYTALGTGLFPAIAFLCVCFMLQVVTARLICQGGLPYFTLTAAPSDGYLAMLPSGVVDARSLALAAVTQKAVFVDMRESLMPSLFHAAKLSEGASPRRRFLLGVVLALGAGVTVSLVAMMILYHGAGASYVPDDWAVETTRRVYENVAQLVAHPEESKQWSLIFSLVGVGVMVFLVSGFHRFVWWPLHPIGYLASYSSAMRILWFSCGVGWLANVLVMRYGGAARYREVRHLFIGMVVGDILMAAAWMIVGLFSSIRYHVLPL